MSSEYPRGTPRRGRDPSSTMAPPPARDRPALGITQIDSQHLSQRRRSRGDDAGSLARERPHAASCSDIGLCSRTIHVAAVARTVATIHVAAAAKFRAASVRLTTGLVAGLAAAGGRIVAVAAAGGLIVAVAAAEPIVAGIAAAGASLELSRLVSISRDAESQEQNVELHRGLW